MATNVFSSWNLLFILYLSLKICAKRYTVVIKTGDENLAGTDNDVWIRIYGNRSKTGWLLLDTPKKNDFERNQLTYYTVSWSPDLNNICGIDIRKSGTNYWHLDYVKVAEKNKRFKTYTFYKWIILNIYQRRSKAINGKWGSWTEWGNCVAVDGLYKKHRARVCDSPSPLCGGQYCVGISGEHTACRIPTTVVTSGYTSVSTSVITLPSINSTDVAPQANTSYTNNKALPLTASPRVPVGIALGVFAALLVLTSAGIICWKKRIFGPLKKSVSQRVSILSSQNIYAEANFSKKYSPISEVYNVTYDKIDDKIMFQTKNASGKYPILCEEDVKNLPQQTNEYYNLANKDVVMTPSELRESMSSYGYKSPAERYKLAALPNDSYSYNEPNDYYNSDLSPSDTYTYLSVEKSYQNYKIPHSKVDETPESNMIGEYHDMGGTLTRPSGGEYYNTG